MPQSNCQSCGYSAHFEYCLKPDDFSRLSIAKHKTEYKRKEFIIRQDAAPNALFFLKGGIAKIHSHGGEKKYIIGLAHEGSYIGLSNLNKSTKYPFSVSAVTDCEVCVLNIDTVRALMLDNSRFAVHLFDKVTLAADNIRRRYHLLSTGNSLIPVADLLIQFSDIYRSPSFQIPLSRSEMGEYTGLSDRMVYKMLGELKECEIIDFDNNTFNILKPTELQKLIVM